MVSQALVSFGEVFLPATCPCCDSPGRVPCASCRAELNRAAPFPVPAGLDSCMALWAYEGAARRLVSALKYRNARRVLPFLGDAIGGLASGTAQAVTWIPATAAHRRDRGFDQCEMLAKRVGRRLKIPARRTLRRNRAEAGQTGRNRGERLLGPQLTAVRAVHTHVLLIDDVITTGASMSAAAFALREAGVQTVEAIAVARTSNLRRQRGEWD